MSISKRQSEGQKTGIVAMLVNFTLFAGKLVAGLMSNSIAILADSFNNLADCGTSLATVIGFRFGARHADKGHPFGHGRMEYVAGLVVGVVIFVTAFSVGESALRRIFATEPVTFSVFPAVICVVAIAAKIGLALYIRRQNRTVASQTLNASFWDCLTDTLATTIALLSLILAPLTSFPLDGILGLAVALFIVYAGIAAFWSNLNLILGQGLTKPERAAIRDVFHNFTVFKRVEELDVHDYGPESKILLAKVDLAASPHTENFESEMKKCKKVLTDHFGFEEIIIYWPPNIHKKS
ncbi:MAG: cation diffusion facilitator family transporter [Candidatus Nomurabacteria bacterium]|jgi:cation diffusion facilitator family transporter|nr:cation diffusion facilitator family transporter [Candidatus Nomurabacteria bacterium]